ncbi:MAG: hypothetical protein E6J33_00785 [Chloroflexi bacterium]|nr:MAG: hypothetical protein E6J33_00785 [Chloroflexota bacterium]
MERHYSQGIFLADDPLPKDEIDDLPSLIQKILTSISHLSCLTTSRPQPDPRNEVDEMIDPMDSPVVRNENLPPS